MSPWPKPDLPEATQSFQTLSERLAVLPGGVAEVDDELSALDHAVVVDSRVVRDDGDAVVGRRVELGRLQPELGQAWDVRVVIGHVGTRVPQQLDHLQGGRLARVEMSGL